MFTKKESIFSSESAEDSNKLSALEYDIINDARLKYIEALNKYAKIPSDFAGTMNCLINFGKIFNRLFFVLKSHIEKKMRTQKKPMISLFCCFSSQKKFNQEDLFNDLKEAVVIKNILEHFLKETGPIFKDAFKKEAPISNFMYIQKHTLNDFRKGIFTDRKGREEFQVIFCDGSRITLHNFSQPSLIKANAEFNKKMEELQHKMEKLQNKIDHNADLIGPYFVQAEIKLDPIKPLKNIPTPHSCLNFYDIVGLKNVNLIPNSSLSYDSFG